MKLVVDANVWFAALVKARATRKLLLVSEHEFFTPEYAIQEIRKHLPELRRKTGLAQAEVMALLDVLVEASETKVIPLEAFRNQEKHALQIAPDKNDAAYLALALHLDCPLWSNDAALKQQAKVKVITTTELLQGKTRDLKQA